MGTYTSRLGLFLPAGSDAADIATIIAAWQKLDGTSGLILCTSSTRPTTNKFPGMFIKETDTSKHYYLDGTGSWAAGVYTGGAWIEDTYYTALALSGGQVFYVGEDTSTSPTFTYTNSGGAWPTTTTAVLTPITVVTAAANQRLIAEFDLLWNVSADSIFVALQTTLAAMGSGNLGLGVYLNVDGTDTLVDALMDHNLAGYNAGNWLAPKSAHQRVRVPLTIPVAGSHTIGLKLKGGGNYGGALATLNVESIRTVITLSS